MWGVRGRALSDPQPLVLSGVQPGPTTHWLWVRGVRAWGPVTNLTARTLASWFCAFWGRHEGALGGRLLPGCAASGVGCSPAPDHSSSRACGRGPLPTGCGCGGCGRGDPSPTPPRALLRAGFAPCGGGTRVPGGGAPCLGVGRPGSGALPSPTTRPFGRASGAHYPVAVGAVCGRGGPAVLGTFSCAAVRCVLCAPPGFAAPSGRCGLAPSPCRGCGRRRASLAWLIAPRRCAAPWPVWSLSVLRSAFSSPWCLPPPPGLSPPALLVGCTGHVEAGREPGSLCLPLAPAEARALGTLRVVPVRGPAMGFSLAGPSGFGLGLRALQLFACVDLVTDASGFLYRPSFDGGPGRCTGAVLCGRQHLPAMPGSRARVCVCSSWPGQAGRPPGRVLVRLTFSCGRLLCALGLFSPLRAGAALFVVVFRFLFFFLLLFFLVAPPLSLSFRVFRPGVPWDLASCGPPARPPPLYFLCPFPFPPPLPRLFFCFFFCPSCFLFVCCLFVFFFFFALVCSFCGVWAGLCVLRCGVSWCVLLWTLCPGGGRFALVLCHWLLPCCACAACVVACLAAVSWCVLCFARCCVACLCWAWFFPRAAPPCPRCLVPCCGPWLCSLLGCGAALLWWSFVVRCGAVCVVSCWWCRVVSFVPAGAVCCCLWLPAVRCWVWLPAVVFRWRVLSRLLLPGRAACGLLWCPAPLWCVLCSVVLCCRVVPCGAAPLSVFLCWWCWFVSFPCVCGAVLRCASCCSVPVRSALLLVSRAVMCCCVFCCLPCRSMAWRCCSGVSWSLAVPCCVLWCSIALSCRAAGVCCVLCFAAVVPFSFKSHLFVFENKSKM